MADLDFKHHVSEIPRGEKLPEPIQRKVGMETSRIPDFQSPVSNYASATNWMSGLGSKVAASASNEIANRIGGELGKNPHGDMGAPITDFDKQVAQSYSTQAQATLGIEAQKLITKSNLELADQPRLSQDMISKTQQNTMMGLEKIFSMAPSSIRPQMEHSYGSLMIDQNEKLVNRMVKQQTQDMINNAATALSMSAQNAYSFGMSGNEKAAESVIESTRKLTESEVNSRRMSPEDAQSKNDAVRQSFISGKLANLYEHARAQGKEGEFEKSLADGNIIKHDDPDFLPVTNNLMNYINHTKAMRAEDEQLRLTRFQTQIAMNPMDPNIANDLQDLKANVSPVAYERAQLHYINTIKSYNQDQGEVTNALSAWNNSHDFPRLSEKSINQAFDRQVNGYIKQQEKKGVSVSVDQAEVLVASSAAGQVPIFKKTLEGKLLSGKPESILSAVNQISMLDSMEQGRVYDGISQTSKAIATLFQQQQGSMPDTDLARKITDNLSNVKEDVQKTLDNSWGIILGAKGASGVNSNRSLADFALIEVGLAPSGERGYQNKHKTFGGAYFSTLYGNDIYNQLKSNFTATRGDYAAALKMTKDYTDTHYGDTYINGMRQKTDSPIEKVLGYKNNDDVTPFIQKDLVNQLQASFNADNYTITENGVNKNITAKEAFDKKIATEYWETLPLTGDVPEVIRHIRTKDGVKKYQYPVNIVGHSGNQWDVVLVTPTSRQNLFLIAPRLGITSYQPNRQAIDKDYRTNAKKGWFHG